LLKGGKILAAGSCGLKGNQRIAELNISSNRLGGDSSYNGDTSGIIALANAIKDMGALLLLHVASNKLFAKGTKLLAEALKGNQIMTELNVSSNSCTWDGKNYGEMSGCRCVIALASAIPDMGALTSLNLAQNNTGQLVMGGGWHFDKNADEHWKEVDVGKKLLKSSSLQENSLQLRVPSVLSLLPMSSLK
jgi:hypothetical protein